MAQPVNTFTFSDQAILNNWAATLGKGGTAIEPRKFYSKIHLETLQNGLGGFDSAYDRKFSFYGGDATEVSFQMTRDNPIILKPGEQKVTETGYPAASKFTADKFDITAYSVGAHIEYSHRSTLNDYYNLKGRAPIHLMSATGRMNDVVARDSLVIYGGKGFMQITNGIAGGTEDTDGDAADKTNTGYFRYGTVLQKITELNDGGYDVSNARLYINMATYNYMKSGSTDVAKTLRLYETTIGLNSRRWTEPVASTRTVNLQGVTIHVVEGYPFTNGNNTDPIGKSTNLPIQWDGREGETIDKTPYIVDGTILDASILVCGHATFELTVVDALADTGAQNFIVSIPRGQVDDPYAMKGTMALKYYVGFNVIESEPVFTWFHRRANLGTLIN